MNLLESMNRVMQYIEDHLTEKIDSEVLAKTIGCSQWYLQRIFVSVTDISLSEYIRRRRLTCAAFDLQSTDAGILDIALKYGYQSPDAFTRAFKNMHGVTPSRSRELGTVLKAYAPITFVLSLKGVVAMNYRIEEKGKMRVIGKKKWFSMENGEQLQEIPKMWDELTEEECGQLMELAGDSEKKLLGLCAEMYDGGFDYWIGTFSEKECPKDLGVLDIEAGTWAIFEAVGPMRPLPSNLQVVTQRIFSEWFPNSGYEHAPSPEIEAYSEGDMMAPDYKSEVWIPVVKK